MIVFLEKPLTWVQPVLTRQALLCIVSHFYVCPCPTATGLMELAKCC